MVKGTFSFSPMLALMQPEGENVMSIYAETSARYEAMRRNNGERARQITRERFWHLLEVLPPAHWTRRVDAETFMVIECETANLHTWAARIGSGNESTYWEMIAPNDSTHSDILRNVAVAS